MVHSNREAWKRPTHRIECNNCNGPWTREFWFEVVCVYGGSGSMNGNDYYDYVLLSLFYHVWGFAFCVLFWFVCFPPSFSFSFFELILRVCRLGWMCCGEGVESYVECNNVVKTW